MNELQKRLKAENTKKWKADHKDSITVYNREYRQKNRDKLNAYYKEWRTDHKDKLKQYRYTYLHKKESAIFTESQTESAKTA